MNLPAILFLTVGSVLILRTGERIDVQGAVREDGNRVVFRVDGGALYSIPATEIDAQATREALEAQDGLPSLPRKLRVSTAERDRLLRALEQNHTGQPAPRQRILEELPPAPTLQEVSAQQQSEWEWRRQARALEEQVRQAKENHELLLERAAHLESQIRGFLSLGFKPRDFTYQTTMLQYTRDQIPNAELSITRAQRAYDQFREDARRQGVMPGWLR